MMHIGGQIDIMQQQIEKICPKDNEYDLSISIVRSLINKHHKIIAFSNNIESLFSSIALMQFVSNTVIICCIGFLIATVSILQVFLIIKIFSISVILYIFEIFSLIFPLIVLYFKKLQRMYKYYFTYT